ncbi:MAG: ATP-dependent RecD-like DNA helicase [Candidatus Limiplasma sp.]|nr:ATP-dependent RecD-like DNA helicase [Candidatus Limiplasma sp.]MEA5145139.1 ATP-dependent RecD-like DNA helicase [Candidatus Limiplasma sp.]
MEQLTATVLDTTFRNDDNGYTVLRVVAGRSQHTVVGAMPQLSSGENVVFEGDWTEHPMYGKQFSAKTCTIAPPDTLSAVEKYLGSGLIRGIGPATAKLIVKHFGMDAMQILDEHPERLTEVSGIGPKKAAMIIESFTEQMSMRRVMLFLQNYGLSPNLATKIAKYYGENTIDLIRQNPYRMVMDIEGVGFLTADRIALSMGIDPQSEFRVRAALFYLLNEAAGSGGHTFLPETALCERARQLLRVEEELLQNQITQAVLTKMLVRFSIPDQEEDCLCLPFFFHAESEIATRLHYLMESRPYKKVSGFENRIAALEQELAIDLSPMQRQAVKSAVEEGVLIITGGPGTGKTTIIRCIIRLLKEDSDILLCAPTGRAAKRMSEATGEEAKTIHRMLEYGGDENVFVRDENYPLETDCLIVDEMSMVDVALMRGLLRAVLPGTRLILVGDADQLPSVGAGNVLRDLLESGVVPSVRLTDIFRQDESSMIVLNAHRINEGEMPTLNVKGADFFFERRLTQGEAAQTIGELLEKRLPGYLGFPKGTWQREAVRAIQVLSPTKKGDCGSIALNKLLQNALNPERPGVDSILHGEIEFRVGDKVIQTKNDYQITFTRKAAFGTEEGAGVFNGDVGYVEHIDPAEHLMTVCFDEERLVTYQKQQLDALELAYCLTVHKSQGCEFPVVVMPVVGGPPMLMARNLLYTALTRARQLVVLVGREDAIAQMVQNNHVVKRYTTLRARLEATVP